MLPARLLVSIGIYLQSAAHLELTIWQIVKIAEGVDETSQEQLVKSLEIKRITRSLVNKLRRCSKKCKPGLALRIIHLAEEIEIGLENRNLAAHGAFFFDQSSGAVRVAHYFPRGQKANRQWFEYGEVIPDRVINTAIEEIDLLLREAVDIRSTLQKGKSA